MVGFQSKKDIGDASEEATFVEFVDSLFADPKSLFVGLALQVAIMAAFIYDTQELYFAIFILGAVLGAIWRMSIASQYHNSVDRLGRSGLDQRAALARLWESRFVLPSTFTAANIGFFCFFGLRVSGTDFATSVVLCLLLSPLPTIVGRVYGSRRLASFMLFGQFSPVIVGYFALGSATHIFLALLCFPYIALVLGMVENVRATVIRAVVGNEEKAALGRQFDVALSNMSHGLMMFDEEHRVLVMNSQALRLFNIPSEIDVVGRRLSVLLRYARRYSQISLLDAASLKAAIGLLLSRSEDRQQVLFEDGRYLEISINQRALGGAVMILEDVTERVLSEKKIERMARFDGLTGLANRQHFEAVVAKTLRTKASSKFCALLVVDIDDFKYVNDAIGHAQGDELLRSVARHLQRIDQIGSVACRLGGDEFLVFIDGLDSQGEAHDHVNQLAELLSGVHQLADEEVYASCSIGFYAASNADFDLEKAIGFADLALYSAKAGGKGGWRVFEQSMGDQSHRRQKMKKRLGNAIANNELSLIFQPLVDASTGKLVSCEALSRWHDAELGSVSPAEYIPLAEEMGVIKKITAQALSIATRECAKWPEHVSVSVNLSQIDFRSGDILSVIDDALEQSGLAPGRLEVEVTETAVTYNEAEMVQKLHAIHARGVRIALDDFGTGQSSLSYLHRLPLDKVKIDRSFVVGIDTGETPLSLLRGITDLCRTLDLDVTVEGVETEAQLSLVVDGANVDRIQGYIYGPGLPASGIDALARLGQIPLAVSKSA